MALLTGKEIHRQVDLGSICIKPYDPQFLGPNSYDLHLGNKLLVYKSGYNRNRLQDPLSEGAVFPIDSRNPPETIEVSLDPCGGWVLVPGRLYIGVTKEWTKTVGFVPRIDGRSSLGRLGVFCHITAGQGDNGFEGTWTLELAVVEPVVIYPGDRLFQIIYETVQGEPTLYGHTGNTSGRYNGQIEPTPTRIHE